MKSEEFVDIEQLNENLNKWFKEKWVRFGPDGKIRGACARGSKGEGKPKCLPKSKAQSLGKKGRKYAGAKKRREDPNANRSGAAKNVATKKKSNESMNEGVPFNECPQCRGPIVHESMMTEKQDACYHKVKSRYKVWPSAYASGALVQCRKKGASNWGTGGKKNENSVMKGLVDEAKAAQYVKPYIENGKQVGYVSSDGYHKKYWRLTDTAKAKAYQHAKLEPEQVDEEQLDEACWKGYHKEGNKKMFGKTYPNCVKNKKSNEDIEEDNDRVARKPGQPANSKKHSDLYTDENPKGTITGLKFATAEDARASVSKIRKSGRSHAHKIQAAVAMEQRAKAAGKAEAASIYRKYINATKKTDESVKTEEALREYRGMSPSLKAAQDNLTALRNKEKTITAPNSARTVRNKVEIDKPKPATVLAKGAQEVDPDTQAAIAAFLAKGGEVKKGRAGKAPPVGRNQASKHIGGAGSLRRKGDKPGQGANYRGDKIVAVEDELDEACWDSHKQVGMKKKGNKMVPNCVAKESAIMKGLKSL